jgi:hypothetical protein
VVVGACVQVVDYDMLGLSSATKMGAATLDFSQLAADRETEYWLDLEEDEKSGPQPRKDGGRIHVKVSTRPPTLHPPPPARPP